MVKRSERGEIEARRREKDGPRSPQQWQREIDALKATLAGVEEEKARLEAAVEAARADCERLRAERRRLAESLARAEAERRELSAQFIDGERSHAGIASLYVATDRLHASLDRREVLLAIQEIITNLIGCEELAVFEVDASGSRLSLSASMGIDEGRYATVAFGEGVIGRVAATGEPHFASATAAAEAPAVTACVPLKRGSIVTGAIAIFRLLSHKSALTGIDRELLSVLIPHAALALYCCALHVRAGGAIEACA
jgi:predicted RNase H-like nuclease (RuvC/YqgF family)